MTPGEFKAWFDGFCEAFDKAPSLKQWARIKERVAEIDGKPVTERVYVDRYLPYIRPWVTSPYYTGYWSYSSLGGIGAANGGAVWDGANNSIQAQYYQNAQKGQQSALNSGYNSTNAMNALGRAEAQAMTQ